MNRTRRTSRGHASIEYVLLAGLIAGMLGMGFTLPTAFADLLMTAESNMDAPEVNSTPGTDAVADAGNQDGSDDSTGSGGFDDDPWSGGNSGCNQGVGNGGEGCDPGNSNNNQSSNDEDGGSPGNPGRSGSK